MTIIPGLLETQQSHLTHTYASTHLRGGAVVSLHFTKEKVSTISEDDEIKKISGGFL